MRRKNIRISLETYVALQLYRARLAERLRRPVSLDEALRRLLFCRTRIPKYVRKYGRRLARALLLLACANRGVYLSYSLKEIEMAWEISRDLGLNVDVEDYVKYLAVLEAFKMLNKSGLTGLFSEVREKILQEENVLRTKPHVLAAKAIASVLRTRKISIRKVLEENGVSYFYIMRIYSK